MFQIMLHKLSTYSLSFIRLSQQTMVVVRFFLTTLLVISAIKATSSIRSLLQNTDQNKPNIFDMMLVCPNMPTEMVTYNKICSRSSYMYANCEPDFLAALHAIVSNTFIFVNPADVTYKIIDLVARPIFVLKKPWGSEKQFAKLVYERMDTELHSKFKDLSLLYGDEVFHRHFLTLFAFFLFIFCWY